MHDLVIRNGTVVDGTDAGAHCNSICDGSIPTRAITHWTRDRTRGTLTGDRPGRLQRSATG